MQRIACIIERLAGRVVIGSMVAAMALPTALAQPVLYGGLGGHGVSNGPRASTNDGSLVIVSQTDGSTRVVRHRQVSSIAGLAFGGCTLRRSARAVRFPPPPGLAQPSDLIRINPDAGRSYPTCRSAEGQLIDLAVHPTTGALYRIRNSMINGGWQAYIIDTTSGAATRSAMPACSCKHRFWT
jgi:hypothetical protein